MGPMFKNMERIKDKCKSKFKILTYAYDYDNDSTQIVTMSRVIVMAKKGRSQIKIVVFFHLGRRLH